MGHRGTEIQFLCVPVPLRHVVLCEPLRMSIWVGTSGYNYREWKGSFYPEKLSASKMLPYYAERFPTVEINYTFYRAPSEKTLEGWSAATPEGFKLTRVGRANHPAQPRGGLPYPCRLSRIRAVARKQNCQ